PPLSLPAHSSCSPGSVEQMILPPRASMLCTSGFRIAQSSIACSTRACSAASMCSGTTLPPVSCDPENVISLIRQYPDTPADSTPQASHTAARSEYKRNERLPQLHCQTSSSLRLLEGKPTSSAMFNLHRKMKTLQVSQEDEETRSARPA